MWAVFNRAAAFGRLCVETNKRQRDRRAILQPPSGGCVLKLLTMPQKLTMRIAAAFGRLCVETLMRFSW